MMCNVPWIHSWLYICMKHANPGQKYILDLGCIFQKKTSQPFLSVINFYSRNVWACNRHDAATESAKKMFGLLHGKEMQESMENPFFGDCTASIIITIWSEEGHTTDMLYLVWSQSHLRLSPKPEKNCICIRRHICICENACVQTKAFLMMIQFSPKKVEIFKTKGYVCCSHNMWKLFFKGSFWLMLLTKGMMRDIYVERVYYLCWMLLFQI